jgi:hypothetical protein
MSKRFEEEGIAFSYPETWTLEREENEEGWTVLVQSPETAFFLIRNDREMPLLEQVVETTLEALKSDYPDLDAEPRVVDLAGQMALGHDIEFVSLDFTNSCWTRSLYTATGTLLVLYQTTDQELDRHGSLLQAICASLEVREP